MIFSMWDPEFGENVVRITITNHGHPMFVAKVRAALKKMCGMITSLTYDLVDKFVGDVENVESEDPVLCVPTTAKNKLMKVLNLMNYVMDKSGHRFRGGVFVRKDPRSTASYTLETGVRDFLNNLCSVDVYRNVVTPQIDSVVKFFRNNAAYKGIRQIKVDMNLIEVNFSQQTHLIKFMIQHFCNNLSSILKVVGSLFGDSLHIIYQLRLIEPRSFSNSIVKITFFYCRGSFHFFVEIVISLVKLHFPPLFVKARMNLFLRFLMDGSSS